MPSTLDGFSFQVFQTGKTMEIWLELQSEAGQSVEDVHTPYALVLTRKQLLGELASPCELRHRQFFLLILASGPLSLVAILFHELPEALLLKANRVGVGTEEFLQG